MEVLDLIRKLYKEAAADLEGVKELWEVVKDFDQNAAVLYAYKAATKALKAKESWLPHTKWNYIQEAMEMFKQAIEIDPENIEIRFLRFTVQHNTPDFLELSDELEEDLASLVKHIHRFAEFNLEEKQMEFMFDFLKKSERLSTDMLHEIRQIILPPSE